MLDPVSHSRYLPSWSVLPSTSPPSSGAPSWSSAGRAGGSLTRANTAGVKAPQACETCQRRKYQDVSTDPGVSFKTAASVAPEASAAVVRAHEGEHVRHQAANADREGREVVYQSVQMYTGVCPECGRTYVAGGKTTTVTRGRPAKPSPASAEPGAGETPQAQGVDLYL